MAHLGLNAEQVFVTHEAASPSFRHLEDGHHLAAIRHKYALPADFILAIGSADPRKNISTLVEAYSLLPLELQAKHHLAIVWTHSLLADQLSKKIESLALVKYVRFLSHVPTEDLVLLYNAASLFVFPSLYEGFGLPPLEAMACGTPVAASDNSSMPEILGNAALLFDAKLPESIGGAMQLALTESDACRAQRSQNGLERARSFSWDRCAVETLEIYRRALSSQ
jgi:glycosyltransferase involved in cell wall biosynthesis